MTGRRSHGEGSVDQRGPDTWRLRYRIGGKRFAVTVHGTKAAAQRELRRLLREGDVGEHIAPNRMTFAAWAREWLDLLSRGSVTARTREGYADLLRLHVLPQLGARELQRLTVTDIDGLYADLGSRLSAANIKHTHIALQACLGAAVRKGLLKVNPASLADAPRAVEPKAGQALDPAELKRLLAGFSGSALRPFILTAVLTGARLGELLGLRWSDLDATAGTLTLARAVERTREFGLRFKSPKSARGNRTIQIDDTLLAVLLAEHDKLRRLVAGVGDADDVDLSLIRLPAGALMFPSPEGLPDLTRTRHPAGLAKQVGEHFRRLGFKRLRFHDLRASHGTALLDAGVPVHVVAARLGHDPAVLLRAYAKRNKRSDEAAARAISALAKAVI